MKRHIVSILVVTSLLMSWTSTVSADPPRLSFIPFKRVEADPNKKYELTDANGPWLILASSFAGPEAEQQAHDLVLELRKEFKLPAYVHKQRFDFSKPVVGLGVDRHGDIKRMKHANDRAFDEIAVLVGNYESIEDPNAEKALQKLKYTHPKCLDLTENKNLTQRYAGLRSIYRMVNLEKGKPAKGPMGSAFVSRNPLIPDEYFTAGMDPFVVKLNEKVPFSALKIPGKYSVKVATFSGYSTIKRDEMEKAKQSKVTKLEEAADKAHQLTVALRAQGVEAYEFHDRHESMVMIGSFESVGEPRADGKIEINPAVHRIMEMYGATRKGLPDQAGVGLMPRSLNKIPYDIQPMPVQVPKVSIAANYSRGGRDE